LRVTERQAELRAWVHVGHPDFVRENEPLVQIPDDIRHCVAFLYACGTAGRRAASPKQRRRRLAVRAREARPLGGETPLVDFIVWLITPEW
jgi:hypothetical protein